MTRIHLLAAGFALAASPAFAADYTLGALKIEHPSSRETPIAGGVGAGYLAIVNTGKDDDRLVGASAAVADHVEIHTMSMAHGMMEMRALPDGLPLPHGQTTTLAPGGTHLMLMNLKHALKAGEQIPVELDFAKAGKLTVEFKVEPLQADQSVKPMPMPMPH